MICPRCGSMNVSEGPVCDDCGYCGGIPEWWEDTRPEIVRKADRATQALCGQRPLNAAEAEDLARKTMGAIMPKQRIYDFRVEGVSLIPAPKCGQCDHRMQPHDDRHWHCANPACIHAGKPVHTGGYPFFIVKPDPTLAPNTAELRDAGGNVQARLINIGEETIKRDDLQRAARAIDTGKAFVCPKCGRISYNPHDVENGYCGGCHDFTGDLE